MKKKFPQSSLKIPSESEKKVKSEEQEKKTPLKVVGALSSRVQGGKSIFVFLGTFAFFLYFLAFIFGGEGIDAPLDIFSHSQKGEFAFLLLFGFVILFLVSRELARGFIIISVVLLIIYILIISIWPGFSPRESLRSVGQGKDQETSQEVEKRELTPQEKLQKSVAHYTQKWGEPQKVVLDDDEWKKVCKVNKDDKINYLSLYEFEASTGESWGKAVVDKRGRTFYTLDKKGGTLYLKKEGRPTTVYCWLEH